MVNKPWWQTTTIYQVYPRSFKDTNNDGIGDIRGIISKLDYIDDLGFETLWISPFFSSPQSDWGYDVSDYYTIAPEYGALADVEELISAVHQRGMRILFDLVMNHTSEEHPWFQESRSSRENPKRDWYIWRSGRGERPPNNWKAIPGGSGWQYDIGTDQWYYASFLPFQPDLNYRNPELKTAMFDVAQYWLNKGVDGFRLDIFHSLYKDDKFRDNPSTLRYLPTDDLTQGWFQKWVYNLNRPETIELAMELRKFMADTLQEGLLLGEVYGNDVTIKSYLGDQNDGLNLVFSWKLEKLEISARFFRNVLIEYEIQYPSPYTPAYVFGNHDLKRLLSKIGQDIRIAKILALFQFTVRGVPVSYYGEEIGMLDGNFPTRNAKDPMGARFSWVPDILVNRMGFYINRDGCRTPMQWDDTDNAGFCSAAAQPWLPVHQDYMSTNVKSELADPDSLLNIYKGLLRLRRDSIAMQEGTLDLLSEIDGSHNLLAYRRMYEPASVLVVINFGDCASEFVNGTKCHRVLFVVGMDIPANPDEFTLAPYSGIILGNT
jgi:oligo-1,6-glucosidase/alpha-glucosidase